MPEPKTTRRSFEARSGSALADVRIVPQSSARTEACENQPLAGEGPAESANPPEPALVTKLIDFIKSM